MESVHIGRWQIKCDFEATRRTFSEIHLGSPEACGCGSCLNFVANRDKAYPSETLFIFERLGIDFRKESEIWHSYRDESGLHHYNGFFHFVGFIESGKNVAIQVVNGYSDYDFESVGEYFRYGFTSDAQLIPECFTGEQVTQLEFETKIPWVLNITEPD